MTMKCHRCSKKSGKKKALCECVVGFLVTCSSFLDSDVGWRVHMASVLSSVSLEHPRFLNCFSVTLSQKLKFNNNMGQTAKLFYMPDFQCSVTLTTVAWTWSLWGPTWDQKRHECACSILYNLKPGRCSRDTLFLVTMKHLLVHVIIPPDHNWLDDRQSFPDQNQTSVWL